MESIYLSAGNQRLHGWKDVSVFHSMDAFASTFELSYNEKYENFIDVSLALGAPVTVSLGNSKLLTGWLEDLDIEYDADHHLIAAGGRSKAGDVVDCPLDDGEVQNKQFRSQTLDQIAIELCKPFGIEVVVDPGVDVGSPLTQTIEEGQSIHSFLDQLARYRALRFVSDFDSRLHITKPGIRRTTTALELGQNIKRGRGRFSTRGLYSTYTILSQLTDFGGDQLPGVVARQKGREVEAFFEGRHRPFVSKSDRASTSDECLTRARFEKRTRNGRAQGVTYQVPSWRDDAGDLWQINTLVPVYDPLMGIHGDRLISDVRYIHSSAGQYCEITVKPLSAFDMEAQPEKQQAKFF